VPGDPRHVMHYFVPGQVPVLSRLALEFAVCDRWFASAPCQTWPNRLFLHSGTAKDVASPSETGYENNRLDKVLGQFSSPTVFKKLQNANGTWKIYHRFFAPSNAVILSELWAEKLRDVLFDLLITTNTFANLAEFFSD